MKKLLNKYYYNFILHFTVLIWASTGSLGKLIALKSDVIVIYRMLIAFIILYLYSFLFKNKVYLKKKDKLKMYLLGIIIALHWITFFEAIKISNVSISLCCLSSSSFFVSIIEPLFFKKKIKIYEISLGVSVIIGILIIFNFESNFYLGIIMSIISAILASIFSVWNAILVKKNSSLTITINEMKSGSIFLLIISFLKLLANNNYMQNNYIPNIDEVFYILILGIICTGVAFVLGIEILKKISPFSASLTMNLEPIYGIILAITIFGESEKMSKEFYLGSFIIISSIIINGIIKEKTK